MKIEALFLTDFSWWSIIGIKSLKYTYIFQISVPGGNDGPSGVLICSENYITYMNLGDQPDIRCPIPRRRVSTNHIRIYIRATGILNMTPIDIMIALNLYNLLFRTI